MAYITQIPDKRTHDNIVAESASIPTIIYVSNSSLPHCKAFTPQYEALANRLQEERKTNCSKRNVRFCELGFATETAAMFKFSPNQLPVIVLMCNDRDGKNWARTMMSPRIRELELAVEDMRERAGQKLRS
jgi:thiol-disulfide isomerase/thioredoxin